MSGYKGLWAAFSLAARSRLTAAIIRPNRLTCTELSAGSATPPAHVEGLQHPLRSQPAATVVPESLAHYERKIIYFNYNFKRPLCKAVLWSSYAHSWTWESGSFSVSGLIRLTLIITEGSGCLQKNSIGIHHLKHFLWSILFSIIFPPFLFSLST